MENHEELIQEVKHLISINRTSKALELLAKLQLSNLDKDLIILNSRYSKVKEDQRIGVIDDDVAQRKLNTINRDLLDLSDKIGSGSTWESSSPLTSTIEKSFNKWLVLIPILLVGSVLLYYFLKPEPVDSSSSRTEINLLFAYKNNPPLKILFSTSRTIGDLKNHLLDTYDSYLTDGVVTEELGYPRNKLELVINNKNGFDPNSTLEELNVENGSKVSIVPLKVKSPDPSLTQTQTQTTEKAPTPNPRKFEKKDWQNAFNTNTISSYQNYLNKHPSGNNANKAQQNINSLVENRDWQNALNANSKVSYQNYLNRHPSGPNAYIAQQKINNLSNSGTVRHKGESYKWVKLKDGKKWMTQNIRHNSSTSFCYDNSTKNCNQYGRLYTWSEAQTVCPAQWRLPSEQDWLNMVKNYGDLGAESYKVLTTNEFSGQLGGMRSNDGNYEYLEETGYYWSTDGKDDGARFFYFRSREETRVTGGNKGHAFSCRCLQD